MGTGAYCTCMSVLKVYVAGAYGDRERLAAEAERVRALGIEITSSWLDHEGRLQAGEAFAASAGVPETTLAAFVPNNNTLEQDGLNGKMDIDEVVAADVLMADVTQTEYAYRGTSSELGAALALGKTVICVWGGRAAVPNPDGGWLYSHRIMQSPFFAHPAIIHVDTWDAARAWITERVPRQ